ncbi:hypothetical protein CTZ27_08180 [Streptomyces griseocarneus]|nr:hypothetical protein CTZ27_08180 [Streptomyces griseocarneus]
MLAFDRHEFINFRDFDFPDARRWVDIKRFRLAPDAGDDRDVLAELIGSVEFRDDYAGGGIDPGGERHGSWWLRCIAPAAYTAVDADTAVATVDTWANQFDPAPGDLVARLEKDVYAPLRAATSIHRLTGVSEDDFHDWGSVHIEFYEFVAVDRRTGTLTLVVAADD